MAMATATSPAPDLKGGDRKLSWASEAEEDEETYGLDADHAPASTTNTNLLPVYTPPVPPKSKKNKKKKKPVNRRPDNEPPPRSSVSTAVSVESEFRSLTVSEQLFEQKVQNDDDNGWQVSSSRRKYQQSSQTVSASSNNAAGSVIRANNSNNYVGSAARENVGRVSVQAHHAVRHTPQQKPNYYPNCTDGQSNVFGNEQPNWRPPKAPVQATKTPVLDSQRQAQGTNHTVSSWANIAARSIPNDDFDIMSKLLPSENVEPLEIPTIGRNFIPNNSRAQTETFLPVEIPEIDSDSACSDAELEDDSDWLGSDSLDSDTSVKSLETRKRNKGFHNFFQTLDEFSNNQILDVDRQWHCPACQGGVGAIDWYKGLQPLIAHAKTHRTKRVGLHRKFAKVLEEELEMRRAGTGVCETKFGKWKGLQGDDESKDPNVVWPPMVFVQNTLYELDDQEKWIGMGNKELLDMFSEYSPMKARHSYGPRGHRGMSVVIFADSPSGYFNAERLAKHFKDSRRGRANWENPGKIIFHPGGDRILYGYLPTAEDMEIFNKHSVGKTKLKWELRKYKDAVTQPMKQMDEENQQLHYYKVKMQKQMEHNKTLERSVSVFSKKLELRETEIALIRERANEQYRENQKEMDELEGSYKEMIMKLKRESAKKEQEVKDKQEEFKFEQIERRQQLEKSLENEQEERKQARVKKEIEQQTDILELTLQECEEIECQKRELKRQQHLRKREFIRNQLEQHFNLEREFQNEMQALLEKYMKRSNAGEVRVEGNGESKTSKSKVERNGESKTSKLK